MNVQAMLDRLLLRVSGLISRGPITRSENPAAGEHPRLQATVQGQLRDDVQDVRRYGFASRPRPADASGGPEHVTVAVGGVAGHLVSVTVGDRRYEIALEEGEVAVHDDLGHKVHLTRAGIVVDGGGHLVTFTNTPKVRVEADFEVTGGVAAGGDVVAAGDVSDQSGTAQTMAAMRAAFDAHYHSYAGISGNTSPPTVPMS